MAINDTYFEPLTAGDLVDRAIRLYRDNFFVFILAAAPPVIIGMLVMLGWWYLARLFFYRGSGELGDAAHYIFLWLGNAFIWAVESVAMLVVMGGASKNFIRHILFAEPLRVATIYKNSLERFFPLLFASAAIFFVVGILGGVILYFGLTIGLVLALLTTGIFAAVPFLGYPLAIVITLAAIVLTFWLFFLVASRFAYVPQSITVENLGPLSAIGRSASLAGSGVSRFAALFIFTLFATYSALAILYIPITWYAVYEGIPIEDLLITDPDVIPVWYEVAGQVISQLSVILLAPVWLIGLCLLYIDERVRSESYDLELLATQRLGEIPEVPAEYVNPLRPAIGSRSGLDVAPIASRKSSIFGLND